MVRFSPYRVFFVVWLVLAVSAAVLLHVQLAWSWTYSVVVALNVTAFVLYGLDKLFAVADSGRVPERILWFAAFAGGPVGALAAMYLFRHKTSKVSFQLVLALVILAEVAILFALEPGSFPQLPK